MKKYIAILLMAPVVSHAAFMNGNTLLSRMNGDQTDRIVAIGYVMGVSDATETILHCSGQSVTSGQTRDVVKKWLEKNPEMRDLAANYLVIQALSEAFPCPKKGRGT
jgi:hypothetical protein